MQKHRTSGFSLVELVIVIVIIGVIAAIAIPRVTQATAGAGDTALQSNLSLMRNAIELYATEHNGVYPGAAVAGTFGAAKSEGAFKAQLTMFSSVEGDVSPVRTSTYAFGPYLAKSIPPITVGENKGTDLSNGVEVKDLATALTTEVAGGKGWVYSCVTGEIIANSDKSNEANKEYKDY